MKKTTLALVFLILSALACSIPFGDTPSGEPPTGDGPVSGDAPEVSPDETPRATPDPDAPAAELNCETLGLPCTIDQVDPAVLERGDELLQELKTRKSEGESLEAMQAWLEGLEEVRMVLTNPYGLVFVLQGGLPVGLYDAVAARGLEPAEATDASPGTSVWSRSILETPLQDIVANQRFEPALQGDHGHKPQGQFLSGPYSNSSAPLGVGLEAITAPDLSPSNLALNVPQPSLFDVVGHETPRDNEEHLKRALILSPFDFEYTVPDAGGPVAQILREIRDYKGRVELLLDKQVGILAFVGWDNYDFVMYNGHGGVFKGIDKNTGTQIKSTFLVTGDQQVSCELNADFQSNPGVVGYPTGVGCMGVLVREENVLGLPNDVYQDFLIVTPLFFVKEYPAGLQKAVVLFNGCQSFITDALPQRLAGGTSVYFGWDKNVLADFNPGVMTNLVTKLAKGIPSEQAYEETCGTGGCVDTAGEGATLLRYGTGADLRIREIATLLHPLSEGELDDSDKVPVYGYPADGEEDVLPFYIEVVGVKEEELEDYTIRFEIDGEEVDGAWKLDDPSSVERWENPGEGIYRILDRLPLPFDFVQYQEFTIEALVDLPETGKSYSVKTVPLARNPALGITSLFDLEEEGNVFVGNASGEVPLSLVKIDETQVRFESIDQPGGLIYDSADFIITQANCQVTTTTTDGSMDVPEALFPADGFTNTGLPPPIKVVMIPTEAITESFTTVCEGARTDTGAVQFWRSAFALINEDLLVDGEGWVWNNWEIGGGDVYGFFERDKSVLNWEGVYTLEIREPQQ